MQDLFDHPQVLVVQFADCTSFEQCRQRVIERVDERFGPGEKDKTAEVDVIGESMGGLVAVVSNADFGDGQRRLNARRIFTLSSPLRGARLAQATPWPLTDLHRDMRPGSPLYQKLATAHIDAQLYSYTRLDDSIVGEDFASLDGRSAWWVDTPPLQLSHIQGVLDNRILADVSRRLRGETAYATSPPAPLPEPAR
jgi:pimeloyl-ACP methyl ester carboxylesterase